jgi:hypothetical protein
VDAVIAAEFIAVRAALRELRKELNPDIYVVPLTIKSVAAEAPRLVIPTKLTVVAVIVVVPDEIMFVFELIIVQVDEAVVQLNNVPEVDITS